MKHVKENKSVRLPQIVPKQTSSQHKDPTPNLRVRPYSSNKVTDLQNYLLNQLDQYDCIDRKTTKNLKSRRERYLTNGTKETTVNWIDLDAPYLKRLEKVLPDTYIKLMEFKKQQPIDNKPTPIDRKLSKQPTTEHEHLEKLEDLTSDPEDTDSWKQGELDEREAEQIFQQFLEKEGLTAYNQLKPDKLKDLNDGINCTEAQIDQIRNSMYDIIRKLGNECISVFEQ